MEQLKTLDGWELVDSVDGRRFYGHIVKRENAPEGSTIVQFERVFMEPAFELTPHTLALLPIPQQNPQALLSRQAQPEMQIVPQWFSSSRREFTTILDLPYLTKYDTMRCGGMKLYEAPMALQKILMEVLNKAIVAVQKNTAKMERGEANGDSAKA